MINLSVLPSQFVLYQQIPLDTGKINKIPVHYQTLLAIDAHDPANWLSYTEVTRHWDRLGEPYGVGFVFQESDPFWFLDLDDCIDEQGNWSSVAYEAYEALPGVYVERSISGRGLHFVGTGRVTKQRRMKSTDGAVELYTAGRFMAVGTALGGDPRVDGEAGIGRIVERYLATDSTIPDVEVEWTNGPVAGWSGYSDDDELLAHAKRAMSGAAAFGGRASFVDLWECNAEVLGRFYPPGDTSRLFDYSQADAALAQHLAFWTGNDCERIHRLMLRSSLARSKWEREDYLTRTILKACGQQKTLYNPPPPAPPPGPGDAAYLTCEEQLKYFEGCAYVSGVMRIWMAKTAELLRPEDFRNRFAGYIFALDQANKKATSNAWRAIIDNRGYRIPRITNLRYQPLEEPGAIRETEHGKIELNTWKPTWGKVTKADPGLFLAHVAKILPNENDQAILLDYLAALVQKAGVKFQFTPVIQGVQGNGKSLIYRIMTRAIGHEHCIAISHTQFQSNFNAWIERKLLIGVEEIWIGHRFNLVNQIKALITNQDIAIEMKGVDAYQTGDNCANFLLFSNHKDAVYKTVDDRRFCPFLTAQQSVDDLKRDGMDDAYFGRLFAWLENRGGYEAVAGYLWERPIKLNVRGRAPETSSTAETILMSEGPVVQLLREAWESREPGFMRDMIVVGHAIAYIRQNHTGGASIRTVCNSLNTMGFFASPALGARSRIRIGDDRPGIYVRNGSPLAGTLDKELIIDYYKKHSKSA